MQTGYTKFMPRRGVDEWFWTVGDLQRLQGEMLRSSRPVVATGNCWEPRVDIVEDENSFVIKAEIAGVRGEEIQLLYIPERHSLLIRGFREDDGSQSTGRRFHQMEIPSGEFAREVNLPDAPIDPQNMRSQYRNGFLLVMIPKAESVVVTQITIQGL
jgi:Molecular chaperone (small heat shock protein)